MSEHENSNRTESIESIEDHFSSLALPPSPVMSKPGIGGVQSSQAAGVARRERLRELVSDISDGKVRRSVFSPAVLTTRSSSDSCNSNRTTLVFNQHRSAAEPVRILSLQPRRIMSSEDTIHSQHIDSHID